MVQKYFLVLAQPWGRPSLWARAFKPDPKPVPAPSRSHWKEQTYILVFTTFPPTWSQTLRRRWQRLIDKTMFGPMLIFASDSTFLRVARVATSHSSRISKNELKILSLNPPYEIIVEILVYTWREHVSPASKMHACEINFNNIIHLVRLFLYWQKYLCTCQLSLVSWC